jgi:hypothetical protein
VILDPGVTPALLQSPGRLVQFASSGTR